MKVSVNDCLSLEAFVPSILAAGRRNIGNRVRSVSVMDASSINDAVTENGVKEQLVLTSFAGISSNAEKAQVVKALSGAGIAAMARIRKMILSISRLFFRWFTLQDN